MKVAIIGRTEMLFETAVALLESGFELPLIVTAKEAPEYSKRVTDFENLAVKIGATFMNTPRISDQQNIEKISSLGEIDIAVSVNYISVISQKVIDLFRLGILNAHSGDLPRYRGNACQAWAIINGENRIGLCIHKMNGGELDSGDIIARDYLPINLNTKIGETYQWMSERIPTMMVQAVKQLEENPNFVLEVQSKNPLDALRCYPRLPEDGRIDWRDTNEQILRLINASSEPYSGAFCEFDERKMIIWDAELYDDGEIYLAIPGQVAQVRTDGAVIIICGKGKLKIKEVEIGNTRIKPNQIIKSIRKRLK